MFGNLCFFKLDMRTLTGLVEKLESFILPAVNGKGDPHDRDLVVAVLSFFSFILKNSTYKRFFLSIQVLYLN